MWDMAPELGLGSFRQQDLIKVSDWLTRQLISPPLESETRGHFIFVMSAKERRDSEKVSAQMRSPPPAPGRRKVALQVSPLLFCTWSQSPNGSRRG